MKNAVLIVIGLVCALVGSGCATIVSGRNQDIHVTSNPPGVKVKADNGVEVTAPGDVTLARNKPHTLLAHCEGSEPQRRELECGVNGWLFGNILFGGLIGIVVDMASGAHGELSPKAVHFDFTEAGKLAEQRKQAYFDAHPKVTGSVRKAIQEERPRTGMDKDAMLAAFGEPDEITQEGKYEKCVYESRDPQCWYIRNGTIQKTRRLAAK